MPLGRVIANQCSKQSCDRPVILTCSHDRAEGEREKQALRIADVQKNKRSGKFRKNQTERRATSVEAPEGLTSEDKKIAVRVMDAGRAFMLAANKWDLVEEKDRDVQELAGDGAAVRERDGHADIGHARPRCAPLPSTAIDLHGRWTLRVSTAKVNEVIQRRNGSGPRPGAGDLHYATQVATGPPSFVIFGGAHEPDATYQRYLENRLRRTFDLDGVPIRLRFRAARAGADSAAG